MSKDYCYGRVYDIELMDSFLTITPKRKRKRKKDKRQVLTFQDFHLTNRGESFEDFEFVLIPDDYLPAYKLVKKK